MLTSVYERDYLGVPDAKNGRQTFRSQAELDAHLAALEKDMRAAAANLDFEKAATLRDEIRTLQDARPGARGALVLVSDSLQSRGWSTD